MDARPLEIPEFPLREVNTCLAALEAYKNHLRVARHITDFEAEILCKKYNQNLTTITRNIKKAMRCLESMEFQSYRQ